MKKQTKLLVLAAMMVFLVLPLAVFELTTSQNEATQSAAHSGPIRVACVGDSITAESGYPSDLQALLGANYTVGNFGSSGSTVSLNSWKPYMNQTEFQRALDFNPDIVIIMLGTNDDLMGLHQYNDSFEDDYGKLIISFQQTKNNPTVIIANSQRRGNCSWTIRINMRIRRLSNTISSTSPTRRFQTLPSNTTGI